MVRFWNKQKSSLYNQPKFVDYKEMHYKAKYYRNVRDKYNALLESVQNDIDRGNQSGKEGDNSLLYQHVQQIQKDIAELEAEKESKVIKKNEMNDIEKSVLSMGKVSNKPNPLKRKRLDGTIEDNCDDRKPKKNSFNSFLGFSVNRFVLYGFIQQALGLFDTFHMLWTDFSISFISFFFITLFSLSASS